MTFQLFKRLISTKYHCRCNRLTITTFGHHKDSSKVTFEEFLSHPGFHHTICQGEKYTKLRTI